MWQRWNSATKIFEKSDNNGVSWTPLGLDASIITQGVFDPARLPGLANVAYTNVENTFTNPQQNIVAPVNPYALWTSKDNTGPTKWGAGNNGGDYIITEYGNPTHRVVVGKTTGVVRLPVGKLQFPSTQNSDIDPNTLDDYREGLWTPAIGAGAGTGAHDTQGGYFIKIGRFVFAQGYMQLSGLGSMTGATPVNISLPLTALNVASAYGASCSMQWGGMNSNWQYIWALVLPATNYVLLRGLRGGPAGSAVGGLSNAEAVLAQDLGSAAAFVISVAFISVS